MYNDFSYPKFSLNLIIIWSKGVQITVLLFNLYMVCN